jgi:ParB family transcriptional regulator, chromosome partitioning protein
VPLSGRGPKDADIVALERQLSARLGLPVRLRARGGGWTLQIVYRSLEQLNELIRRLT